MNTADLLEGILKLDTNIRFIGLLEKSGHLYSGGPIEGIVQHLTGQNSEVSLSQTAHMVQMRKNFSTDLGELKYMVYAHDKVLVFSIPILEDLILVFSTESDVNVNSIVTRIMDYIKSVEPKLKLEKPRKMVDEEKRRMVINLYDSGITEDLIAEQMDLDINTVKTLIQEPIA
ncbi:MAG: hypothetical protein GEU26_04400 [Nitrososphaeraceae archaeon]|nr:hypothetical protein [Nitrososphaeraceae archaeon]